MSFIIKTNKKGSISHLPKLSKFGDKKMLSLNIHGNVSGKSWEKKKHWKRDQNEIALTEISVYKFLKTCCLPLFFNAHKQINTYVRKRSILITLKVNQFVQDFCHINLQSNKLLFLTEINNINYLISSWSQHEDWYVPFPSLLKYNLISFYNSLVWESENNTPVTSSV